MIRIVFRSIIIGLGLFFIGSVTSKAADIASGKAFGGPGPAVMADICTDCLFPITIFGAPIGGTSRNVPQGNAKMSVCWCHHIMGIPIPGATYGMWLPERLIETVRKPYHSPSLGIDIISSGLNMQRGGLAGGSGNGSIQNGFYNVHVFVFPIGAVLSGIMDVACAGDTSGGMTLALMSEIDPMWTEDSLSMVLTPEAAVFSSLPAQIGCIADSAAADAYQPIEAMFWCMGSWGAAYPQDGNAGQSDGPRQSAYITAKATAMLQRTGLISATMGDAYVCHALPQPILMKQQYKLQQAWPNPELTSDHWIGEDPNIWGAFRFKPVTGEDQINFEFQWINCCVL